MIIDSLVRRLFALKNTIPAVLLLGSLSLVLAPQASAQMTLTFTETNGTAVLTYSGSWDNWSPIANGTGLYHRLTQSEFWNLTDTYSYNSSGTYTSQFPWTTATVTAVSGDNVGIDGDYRFAPANYISGTQINGSMTFGDTTLTGLGMTAGTSGSITMFGDHSPIAWTASAAAIPEPSTYAVLCGLVVLGCAVWRRRSAST